MSYQYFDFSKISYELALEPPHIKIGYDNENSIKITTPKMTVPFGVDNIFNKYYMKLQFDRCNTDSNMEDFFNLMMTIEQNIKNYLENNIEDSDFVSEFRFSKKFDPTVNIKLMSYNNAIKTKIISNNSSDLSYINLSKGAQVKCVLSLNGVWKIKDKFYYKWNALEIKILG